MQCIWTTDAGLDAPSPASVSRLEGGSNVRQGGIRIANTREDDDDATGAVCLEVGGAGASGDSGKWRKKNEVGGDVGAAAGQPLLSRENGQQ
jgi:hypothetical protein